jgi:hypothetical protein
MPYTVDFNTVSTVGLESSPFADALAGLRANEARYFKNKYDHDFTVEPASDAEATIEWVHRILKEERDIVISSRPLGATARRHRLNALGENGSGRAAPAAAGHRAPEGKREATAAAPGETTHPLLTVHVLTACPAGRVHRRRRGKRADDLFVLAEREEG